MPLKVSVGSKRRAKVSSCRTASFISWTLVGFSARIQYHAGTDSASLRSKASVAFERASNRSSYIDSKGDLLPVRALKSPSCSTGKLANVL